MKKLLLSIRQYILMHSLLILVRYFLLFKDKIKNTLRNLKYKNRKEIYLQINSSNSLEFTPLFTQRGGAAFPLSGPPTLGFLSAEFLTQFFIPAKQFQHLIPFPGLNNIEGKYQNNCNIQSKYKPQVDLTLIIIVGGGGH